MSHGTFRLSSSRAVFGRNGWRRRTSRNSRRRGRTAGGGRRFPLGRPRLRSPNNRTVPAMADWRSYDTIAEAYERIWAPRFEAVARHLLAAAPPVEGSRLLDLGTG